MKRVNQYLPLLRRRVPLDVDGRVESLSHLCALSHGLRLIHLAHGLVFLSCAIEAPHHYEARYSHGADI